MKPVLLVLIVMLTANATALAQQVNTSPVRVWGDFTSVYRTREFNDGDSNTSNWLNIGTVNASSYIWRPWFALVNGSLSLAADESKFSEQETVRSKNTSGQFNFDLFPSSRFPFGLYYNENRSELDDKLLEPSRTTTEHGVTQQYRSLDGAHNLLGEYAERKQDGGRFDQVEGERLSFSSNHNFVNNSYSSDIRVDTIENELQGEHVDSYSLAGQHTYRQRRNFTVENLVSTSQLENDFEQSTFENETKQFSSLLSWQPENNRDINLTAGLRLSDLTISQQNDALTEIDEVDETKIATANINQGFRYRYSNEWSFNQAINANFDESGNEQRFTGTESVGFNYTPDIKITRVGAYAWSVGSNLLNQHGDDPSQQFLNSRFRHSLSNDFSNRDKYQLNSELTQSLGYSYRSRDDDEKILNNSYTLTWSSSRSDNQSLIRFSISDSRSLSDEEREFQLANLLFSGNIRFDRLTQLSGNVTLQRTRDKEDSIKTENTVANGQLLYTRNRAFQVQNLVFKSELRLYRQESGSERIISTVNDSARTDQSWENSLNYVIGRLELSADLDFIKVGSGYDRLIRLQLTRSFGDL
jgi:hypothetical protein